MRNELFWRLNSDFNFECSDCKNLKLGAFLLLIWNFHETKVHRSLSWISARTSLWQSQSWKEAFASLRTPLLIMTSEKIRPVQWKNNWFYYLKFVSLFNISIGSFFPMSTDQPHMQLNFFTFNCMYINSIHFLRSGISLWVQFFNLLSSFRTGCCLIPYVFDICAKVALVQKSKTDCHLQTSKKHSNIM